MCLFSSPKLLVCVVTNWILLPLNMIKSKTRFGGKIWWISKAKHVKLLTDFPLLVKYVRHGGHVTFGRSSNQFVSFLERDLLAAGRDICLSLARNRHNLRKVSHQIECSSCSQSTRLYLGLNTTAGKKRVLVNPWVMAKYATKAASSTLSSPADKKCGKSSTQLLPLG